MSNNLRLFDMRGKVINLIIVFRLVTASLFLDIVHLFREAAALITLDLDEAAIVLYIIIYI